MMDNEIIQMDGCEFWGEYLYLVTAHGHSLLKLFFDRKHPEGCCEIGELNTHPEYRQKGYAKMLVGEAERLAKEKGYWQVLLWTNRDTWVQEWYERMGYEVEEFMRPPSDGTVWLSKFL